MLVLSRKIGEKIVVGKDVEITVVRIDSGRVRLGITAPKTMTIFRDEIVNERRADERGSQDS